MLRWLAAIGRRFLNDRSGATAVTFALAAVPMGLMTTTPVDLVRAEHLRSELQTAVDAGALAAAKGRLDNNGQWRQIAGRAFASNIATQYATSATFTDNVWKIDGVATLTMPMTLGAVAPISGMTIRVTAAAAYAAAPGSTTNQPAPPANTPPASTPPSGSGTGSSTSGPGASTTSGTNPPPTQGGGASTAVGFGPCILVTHPSMQSAIHMNSGSRIDVNCGIQVNSTNRDAIWINSGARIDSAETRVGGGVNTQNGGRINPAPLTYRSGLADPLANLPEPSTGGSCQGVTVNSGQTLTISPGNYCGYFNVNSGATVNMRPGTYVFTTHVNVYANATLNGAGVTMFFAPGGMLQANSNSRWNISAPTSGTYRGVVVFYARNNSTDLILNSSVSDDFRGVFYAPASRLLINSGMDFDSDVAIIVNNIHINGRIGLARPMASCGESATMAPQLQTGCTVAPSTGGGTTSSGGGTTTGGTTTGGATTGGTTTGGTTTGGTTGGTTQTPPAQQPIRLVQ